jgi:DNA helicase HerA-like ATPase
MPKIQEFQTQITEGYSFKGDSIELGGAMLEGNVVANCKVAIPLKTMNRHGLIAGATGSGKTKTLQVLAEQLASKGTPVLLMDIKGDLSGIAVAGEGNPKITERHQKIGISHTVSGNTVEFLTLSAEKGARLRATVTEFGPVLFSKILSLNDTQSSVVSVVFKYCDDNGLLLLDLDDFKKVLNYFINEGKEELKGEYGNISPMTIGTILRRVIELEQQGAAEFFGERSFEVDDLLRFDEQGRGIISIIRLTDIQDRPKLFSTFMLQLLAEIYATFPEEGDLDQPKLCVFIDEAHLVFNEASKALLNQIETIIKLIRSKGVGVYFCTQNPQDIPDAVLGQLGMKMQHALRAFTAKDRQNIRLVAQNYPLTDHYDVENLLTQLGIGEAFVTVLNEKGIPSPLVHTMLRAPQSRMDVLSASEIDQILRGSEIIDKYNEVINRESAYEVLSKKIEEGAPVSQTGGKPAKEEPGMFEKVLKSPVAKQVGSTLVRELTRGLLGVLGLGGKKKIW